jgi:hypothetical protein
VQKIKESRSNLNIHVREISADAIRRDRVIDDFLIVDRDLGWSEQRQIGQVPARRYSGNPQNTGSA